jgi:hypothetical protein
VRPSEQSLGDYTLFFNADNIVHRFRIIGCVDVAENNNNNNNRKYFNIGGRDYTSISSIIDRYMNEDITEGYRLNRSPHKRDDNFFINVFNYIKSSPTNLHYLDIMSRTTSSSGSEKNKQQQQQEPRIFDDVDDNENEEIEEMRVGGGTNDFNLSTQSYELNESVVVAAAAAQLEMSPSSPLGCSSQKFHAKITKSISSPLNSTAAIRTDVITAGSNGNGNNGFVTSNSSSSFMKNNNNNDLFSSSLSSSTSTSSSSNSNALNQQPQQPPATINTSSSTTTTTATTAATTVKITPKSSLAKNLRKSLVHSKSAAPDILKKKLNVEAASTLRGYLNKYSNYRSVCLLFCCGGQVDRIPTYNIHNFLFCICFR